MESKIKIGDHPLHSMLMAFPVAFYSAAFACYLGYGINLNLFWFHLAVSLNIAGVIVAMVATIPDFFEWLNASSISKLKRIGLKHMLANIGALVFFAINAYVQVSKWNEPNMNATVAIVLCLLGLLLTVYARFLGWSIVHNHHIGINLRTE